MALTSAYYKYFGATENEPTIERWVFIDLSHFCRLVILQSIVVPIEGLESDAMSPLDHQDCKSTLACVESRRGISTSASLHP